MKRLGQILRDGAEGQVGESEGRLENASEEYWPLIRGLLASDFNLERTCDTAMRFYQKKAIRFAAIDGSEDQQLLGGLAVFWAGSYAATGTIEYHPDTPPEVHYDAGFVEKGQSLASCVPIYVDSIPEVDPQSTHNMYQSTISRPLTEESTVDNSTIASWIMLFSELYLAYQLAKTSEYQMILLDRSLSGTLSTLIADTAKRPLWRRQSAINGFEMDNVPFDKSELAYGRYHWVNGEGGLPARGDYLRYAIISALEKASKPLRLEQIADLLQVKGDAAVSRLKRYLDKCEESGYVRQTNNEFTLESRYHNSWRRIRRLVDMFGERCFTSNLPNPLRITEGKPRWLTTLDLAFLSLFTLNLLIEECLANRVVLLGITKDTTARDFIGHLVPVCINRQIWKTRVNHAATTDRMLLQAVSMLHYDEVPVPWATIEYDTAFQTIIPDIKQREEYVSGVVMDRIIIEQLFVKSYIQLDKAKSDDRFRSNVLFIDRLYHGDFEKAPTVALKHEYSGVDELVRPVLWESGMSINPMQELVMITLKSMTHHSLPEVFGHNQALFIADKIAKAQRDRAAQIVKATGHWLVSHPKLRKFSFYMNTFRERRSEVEHARGRL